MSTDTRWRVYRLNAWWIEDAPRWYVDNTDMATRNQYAGSFDSFEEAIEWASYMAHGNIDGVLRVMHDIVCHNCPSFADEVLS